MKSGINCRLRPIKSKLQTQLKVWHNQSIMSNKMEDKRDIEVNSNRLRYVDTNLGWMWWCDVPSSQKHGSLMVNASSYRSATFSFESHTCVFLPFRVLRGSKHWFASWWWYWEVMLWWRYGLLPSVKIMQQG